MKVNVGSKNPNKLKAVEEVFKDFDEVAKVRIVAVEVSSEVSGQPKRLEETVNGAINRARNAFFDCDLSVGLESGLLKVPHTKSGYMNITMCAIYDGEKFHLGGSSVFEYPKSIVDLVFSKDYEIDEAAKEIGITDDSAIGKAGGMIGLLTKGKLDRKNYTKQAVVTALIHLINPEHY
ncbi:hypothetical protein A2933_00475 [Candidatus Nomurabacteria bacterium RIFCSPLOWO2_01_FULL_46_18]|uniref:Probable inosine/xanthosine triphosphatase n=1 Tax=Candidatus Nomurabacteria bacterium RIFCSPLOWO2_01_FULL_46_18 TaxID=1801783 RepID=A0A1F6XEJ3_9BACT|nr:MAG: hypothetical protein A2933_00475 [Candidatus Nomurabacteria bacterium RIFCSPLOWO2_01_FULL_46_18]